MPSVTRAVLCFVCCCLLPRLLLSQNPDPSSAHSLSSYTGQFKDRTGGTHTLAELHGHPAVVNFWATWCGPCREEMPRLEKLSEAYKQRGVTFVAISLDDPSTQGKIEEALRKSGLHIPAWTDASELTLKQLGLGELVPSTLVLDENGLAIGRIEGETREKDVTSRLDWVLNGRAGKQPKVVQKNDW